MRVELGSRGYSILIGRELLASAAGLIADEVGHRRCVIITDRNVAGLYLQQLEASLLSCGDYAGSVVLPAGEASKSFSQFERLVEKLIGMGVERGDMLVALGGGVIGDLVGFAASVLRRGVRFVQIPTTLLAQVDSSVGGKTGINSSHGKNLIGTFHQPSLVLIDTDVLDTLPRRELLAGYAEVVKYGLIDRAEFFAWLEKNLGRIVDGDPEARAYAVTTSCKAKAAVVAADERESGRRALLNLGHTFGHALEAWAGYDGSLLHGEGVAIGEVLAFQFSERLGLCPSGVSGRVARHLQQAGLPTAISDIATSSSPTVEELLRHMQQDKKVKGGELVLVLARNIGESFIQKSSPLAELKDFLTEKVFREQG
jgi:3-dehydroquinate synthase